MLCIVCYMHVQYPLPAVFNYIYTTLCGRSLQFGQGDKYYVNLTTGQYIIYQTRVLMIMWAHI